MITWITGQTGSGKSSLARKLRRNEVWLDGDAMRALWPNLGFGEEDRWENNIRIAKLARLLEGQGFDVLVSTICPYRRLRAEVKALTKCRFIYLDGAVAAGEDYPYERDVEGKDGDGV